MTITDGSAAAEQTRARYPDDEGHVERDGVRIFYEVYGDGPSRRSCCCRPGRSSTRASGRRRSPTSRGTSGSSRFDGRGNGRSDRPQEPEAYAETRVRRRRARRPGRAPAPSTRVAGRRCPAERERSLLLAAEHPERVDGLAFIAPSLPLGSSVHARAGDRAGVRRAARELRGLGEVQPPLLARGLRGLPRVLLLADVQRAALHEADRGRASAGASRPTPRRSSRHAARAALRGRASEVARADGARPLPRARHPRRRRRASARTPSARRSRR